MDNINKEKLMKMVDENISIAKISRILGEKYQTVYYQTTQYKKNKKEHSIKNVVEKIQPKSNISKNDEHITRLLEIIGRQAVEIASYKQWKDKKWKQRTFYKQNT